MQQPPRPSGQGGPGAPQQHLPFLPPGATQGQASVPQPGHQLPQQQNQQQPPPRPFQQPHLQAATGVSSAPSPQMPRPPGFPVPSGSLAMGGGVPRPIQQPQSPGVQHGMFRSGSPVAPPHMFRPGQQHSQLPPGQAAPPDPASRPPAVSPQPPPAQGMSPMISQSQLLAGPRADAGHPPAQGANVLPPRSRSAGERQVVPPSTGQHPSWAMGGAPSQMAGPPGQEFRPAAPGMTPPLPRLGTASSTPWQGTPPTSRPMSAQALSHNAHANVGGGLGSAPSVDQATAQFGAMNMGNLSPVAGPNSPIYPRTGRAKRVYNTGDVASPVSPHDQAHMRSMTPIPQVPGPGTAGSQEFQQAQFLHPGAGLPPQPGYQEQAGYPQQPGFLQQPGYPQQPGQAQSVHPAQPGFGQQPAAIPSPTQPRSAQMAMLGGVQPGTPRPKIHANQIPSPVSVQEHDQELFDTQPFLTSSKQMPPLAITDFRAIDEGSSNPRFMRMTTYCVPTTDEMLNNSELPLGIIIQPLAELKPGEAPIEVVDFGEEGPVRCNRCRAYINPFVIFTDGGRRFICNLCTHDNEVPQSYFCNVDLNGRRLDIDQRPEIRCGTVEFAATKEYWARTPAPVSFMFTIDVSRASVQSGILHTFCSSIKALLYGDDSRGTFSQLQPGTKVAIATFDKSLHFYNLHANLEQAQMLVVSDVFDMFLPLSKGFLVDPMESRVIIESLLDNLPRMFEGTIVGECASGAAVLASFEAMKEAGGKVSLFTTSLPIFGPGILRHRDEAQLINTDKERQLFLPQEGPQESMWKDTAEKCVDVGLCFDLYLFPTAYIDVATIAVLPALTGGDTFLYPNFDASRDGDKFSLELRRALTREFGYNALMRVRCSNGLRVAEHIGNFLMKNNTDVELAGVDADKAITVQIKHDSRLDERAEASFQCALLYTTCTGQRRVRVHNLSVMVTNQVGNVFKYGDMDATINLLCKQAISQSISIPLRSVRDALTERCVKVLASYRRNCASSTASGQLILPESYKLFPVYTLAALKCRALRPGVATDVRVHEMRSLKSMGVGSSVMLLYPRLFDLGDMHEQVGFPDDMGRVRLPACVRCSYVRLDPTRAYLLSNCNSIYVWLGRQLSPTYLNALFGVGTLEEVNPSMRCLPVIESLLSTQVRNVITYLRSCYPRNSFFQLVRHQIDPTEFEFTGLLTEDKNCDNMSYVDYLCHVHRQIQTEISQRD